MNRPKQILSAIALLLSLFVSSAIAADADFSECRQTFPHGTPPVVHIQEDALPRALCFSGFALLHSGRSHTPIYVVERLNKQDLANASKIKRKDRFYEEGRLRAAERARLDDYKHSGYDRGHMAPAGDMGTEESKAQSFSLANMVPQSPQNNQRTWRKIESDTRKYVMRATGDVYVFTGPVYGDSPPTIGKGKVWVPQHLFKLVYDPHTKRAWAHWLDNTATARPGKPISYEELVKRTGIEFLPNRSELN